MTLDEKIQFVHGVGMSNLPNSGAGYIPGIARLGIPSLSTADSAAGVNVWGKNGTPLPSTIGLAASWDPAVAYDYGKLIAKELRVLGFGEGLGGGVNLARELRNGRTFEYMGEDPVLAGNMVAQRTQGTQSQNVIATVKHYALNDQEANRATSNSQVDERTMRELALLPFEIAVAENPQPGNIMCSYNLVNGLKACENPYLLTDVLKKEWGFKGKVQSDWLWAVTNTVQAATAGLDEEQSGSTDDEVGVYGYKTYFNQRLKAAVQAGTVPLSRLNDMVQRRLRTYFRYGIIDNPPTASGSIDTAAGDAFALKAAEQSMVLLKNAKPTGASATVLPLNASSLKTILVVGGHADAGVLSGGGSGGVPPRGSNAVTCLDPSRMGTSTFSSCAIWYNSSPLAAIKALAPNATVTFLDGKDSAAAASAAANADVTIVFATQFIKEGADLANLALPNNAADPLNQAYDQEALIAAVSTKAKQSVVVLETGTAVTMPWLSSVHGVLEAWYPGIQGGQAIANILFGKVNPSGKLPITFPVADTDQPQKTISTTSLNVAYSEGLQEGYRWYDAQQIKPLFPFGYGLSYTTFSYADVKTTADSAGAVTVSFTLTNTGSTAGGEVAQVYAGLPSNTGEPPKRLVAWQKVQLTAGQSQQVSIKVPAKRLAIWDVDSHSWKIPAGSFSFYVGSSSRDTQSQVSALKLAGGSVSSIQ